MRVMEAPFRAFLDTLDVRTSQAPQFVDITEHVADIVERSGVRSGMACVFSQHTTMATVTQEAEPS